MDNNLETGVLAGGMPSEAILARYVPFATRFAGSSDALYERRLKFDKFADAATAEPRQKFEAAARAVRDERWKREGYEFQGE